MRKMRGYHLYQNTEDIVCIMKTPRYSSEALTLSYIGITQDDIDKEFKNS
jgi:hypothetical protein